MGSFCAMKQVSAFTANVLEVCMYVVTPPPLPHNGPFLN